MIPSGTVIPSDFEWAAAMATFAEIIKKSPYALAGALPDLDQVFSASADAGDPDRAEFASLFASVRGRVAPSAP